MLRMLKYAGLPARTIALLTAVCLNSCGDNQPIGEARVGRAELEFTNEGYEICTLTGLPKRCPPGTSGDQYCTFDVSSSLTLNRLPPEKPCRYRGRLNITASNVTLDCRNAIIEGEYADALAPNGEPDENRGGIRIGDSTNSNLQNITVKNCNLQNFAIGIGVQNSGTDYATSPKNVRLENVHIKNSNVTGIHIYRYVEGVLITNSRVDNSSGPGIHLSYGSRSTRVEYSRLYRNGRRDPKNQCHLGGAGCNASPREGLTIDGSSDNEIVYSEFVENAAGGIYLYSNCGEDNSNQRPPAEHNLIFKNTFSGSPRAIWVASRQSANLAGFACDPTPYLGKPHQSNASAYGFNFAVVPPQCVDPDKDAEIQCNWAVYEPQNPACLCSRYWCSPQMQEACDYETKTGAYFQDFVDDTTISKNIFHALVAYDHNSAVNDKHKILPQTTVRVEDDNTKIWKNAFVAYSAGELIRIGTPLRLHYRNQPAQGVIVDGNGYLDMSKGTFETHVKYEFGSGSPVNPLPVRTEKACRQGDTFVPPHSSETFYQAPSGTVCVSEERSCREGVLSGSFTYPSCNPT